MVFIKAERLRHREDDVEARRELDGIAGHVSIVANSLPRLTQVCAELIGSDHCSALGIVATGNTPLLRLARLLIRAGFDPTTPLEVYRRRTLALRVRSIGEAASLEINGDGTGFRRLRAPDAAPPVRPKRWTAVGHRAGMGAAE